MPATDVGLHLAVEPVLLAERGFILEILRAHGLDPESLRKKPSSPRRDGKAGSPAAPTAHPDDPEDDAGDEEDEDLDEEGPSSDGPGSPSSPSDQRFQADVARLSRQAVMAAIVAAAEAAGVEDNRFVQVVYETVLNGGDHNAISDTVKRRMSPKRPKGEHATSAISEHAASLTSSALRALLLELALSRSGYYVVGSGKYSKDLQRAIELYGTSPSPGSARTRSGGALESRHDHLQACRPRLRAAREGQLRPPAGHAAPRSHHRAGRAGRGGHPPPLP